MSQGRNGENNSRSGNHNLLSIIIRGKICIHICIPRALIAKTLLNRFDGVFRI